MTPQLARIALCGFAFLTGGVVVNVLYFQTTIAYPAAASRVDRRPGVEQTSWGFPRAPREQRRLPPMQANAAKLENPPEPGATDGKPDTVKAIQRELGLRGYGPVAVDGLPGLATRAAIMAFEADESLRLTGIANEHILKVILLGASIEQKDDTQQPSARAQEVIRAVQNWLITLGYQPGASDGRMTPQTEKAIRAFETNAGLTPRGRISAELVKRLADSVPLKSAAR